MELEKGSGGLEQGSPALIDDFENWLDITIRDRRRIRKAESEKETVSTTEKKTEKATERKKESDNPDRQNSEAEKRARKAQTVGLTSIHSFFQNWLFQNSEFFYFLFLPKKLPKKTNFYFFQARNLIYIFKIVFLLHLNTLKLLISNSPNPVFTLLN